jgi:SAM-dependent methyltransferase
VDRPHESLRPLLKRRRETPPDRELEAGALAHFEDPAYYASTYAERADDVEYYVRVARGRGEVLEHGIGNGRIAIAIARDGGRVTGIDHARPMIADLRRRLRAEPAEVRARVRARFGDIRRAKLDGRFPLVICPFNTALHLYTRADVEAWLARVREHLAPGGELVFDVAMPMLEDLVRSPDTPYRTAPFVHPSAGRVRYHEIFDYDRVRQVLFVSMVFEPLSDGGRRDVFTTPLAHRQFFPQELEALLHYNGFALTALFGDFHGGPLVKESDVMVLHARPTRRARQGRRT